MRTVTPTVTPTGRAAVTPRFPALDTLRAVGAFAVLTTHVAFWGGDYTRHGVGGTVLARLDVGVAIFFVLSGFLLSYPYLARTRLGLPAPSTGRYLWKRLLRIYPVYVLTVVAALALVPENAGTTVSDWLITLGMGGVFVHPELPHGLTQTWSLSVEATFYLALPLLMLAAAGRRRLTPARVLTVLALMVAVDVAWHLRWAAAVGEHIDGSPLQWLPAFLTWFALGVALALAHVLHAAGVPAGRVRSALVALAQQPGSCWALAGGVMLLAATPVAGPTMLAAPTPAQSLTKSLLYATVAGLLVLPGVFPNSRGVFVRLFELQPLRHLGHISYGIFCLHLPLLQLVMWVTGYRLFGGHGVQIWVLTAVVTVACAEVVYRLVERPAMGLKNLGRRSSPAAVATAPAKGSNTR